MLQQNIFHMSKAMHARAKSNNTYTKSCTMFFITIRLTSFYWFLFEPTINIIFYQPKFCDHRLSQEQTATLASPFGS